MNSHHSEQWEAVATMTLITQDNSGLHLAENIDRSAAFAISPEQAHQLGIIPFRWESGRLHVVAATPLTPDGWQLLDSIGPAILHRVSMVDLKLAQWHVYGFPAGRMAKFGEIAFRYGLSDEELDRLLSIQRFQGGLLGSLAVAHHVLTSWDVAQILSEQTGITTINLLTESHGTGKELVEAWQMLAEEEWRNFEMVPVAINEDTITVALTNPFDSRGQAMLSQKSNKCVKALITGKRDILKSLDERFRERNLAVSKTFLMQHRPDDSATQTLTKQQKIGGLALLVLIITALVVSGSITLAVISSAFIVGYATLVGHRLWIIRRGTLIDNELTFSASDIASLQDAELPVYTILIPARDEAAVLGNLTDALSRLDYPKHLLDVKLLLEEDDVATIEAARQARLPNFMEIVIVPPADPRTKPKALNFGLQRAHGKYITIYDAEDLPEPSQLKKAVLAFQKGNARLACVQAKLSYFNVEQNLLTRWFTSEYSAWFNLLLPALHAANLPIPLGGTSNHFRLDILHEIGAWDPYNVTEDADLGIRLNKFGYATAVMDSVTYEEANSEFVNWVRQRSRWIKGYLQTWLVHMRHPLQLRRQLGRRGFWGFQLAILGTPLMFIMNPVYWLLTSLWFMTNWGLIPHLFPPGIYYLGMINLLVGNFVFAYLNAVASAKQGDWNLVPYALMTPIYWTMMSLASWKALLQLITKPSHWEKTHHGLVNQETTKAKFLERHSDEASA